MNDSDFRKLNTLLIDLLENGIYRMNNLGIYHFDIKTENIVYNDQMRLIDWGFARHINKDQIKNPEDLYVNIKKLKKKVLRYYIGVLILEIYCYRMILIKCKKRKIGKISTLLILFICYH